MNFCSFLFFVFKGQSSISCTLMKKKKKKLKKHPKNHMEMQKTKMDYGILGRNWWTR